MVNIRPIVLIFLTIAFIAFSTAGFSQNTSTLHFPKVTFGDINGQHTTKEKVLSNTKLICREPNCEVTGFSFMVLRKDRDIIGPYYVVGDQLTEKIKSTLSALPNLGTSIFIDSIQVTFNNKKMQVNGVSFQYGH